MKLKHFFFLACLLAPQIQCQYSALDLDNFTLEELDQFIEDCLTAGFATAGARQEEVLVRQFSECETDVCVASSLAHTFKVASFQTNVLSLCQGQGMLEASKLVKNRLGLPVETVQAELAHIDLSDELCQNALASCVGFTLAEKDITFITLPDGTVIPECANNRYREIDGFCNNLNNLHFGSPFKPFNRLLAADYQDGLDIPRGGLVSGLYLPAPRLISERIMGINPSEVPQIVTQMVKVWGQFVDHDLTRTPEASGGLSENMDTLILECCEDGELIIDPLVSDDCIPLLIGEGVDLFFNSREIKCLPFVRSAPADAGCILGPREQSNEVTAFLDASNVYGSTKEEEEDLRNWIDGGLAFSDITEIAVFGCSSNFPLNFLPAGEPEAEPNFRAGDTRVNEQPSLAAMHTVWLRVHNRIAELLAATTPFQDEALFQESRRIVIALMQHFTYNDFLPLIIGTRYMESFGLYSHSDGTQFNNIYDEFLNPAIFNVFAAAAFRFGHTLITDEMSGFLPITLGDEFFRSKLLFTNIFTQPSSILEQEARMQALPTDALLDDVLTTRLALAAPEDTVEGFPDHGNDLMALNIMRARDHGIPGYNAWRKFCGLPEILNFIQLNNVMDPQVVLIFDDIYDSVDDIDLFPAAMAERAAFGGGILGPTFSCLIALQFNHLKYGDRFFYENSEFIHKNNGDIAFSDIQLSLIKDTSFAEILCEVTCTESYPVDVFRFDPNQNEFPCSSRAAIFGFLEAGLWFI